MRWIASLLVLGCPVFGALVCGALVSGAPVIGAEATDVRSEDAAAGEPSEESVQFFERHVRPLLAQHCYECHSTQTKTPKGGLRLDSRVAMAIGGDSGPAFISGKPDESLLLQSVRYESYEMPPASKLPEKQIEILARWIELGAPWPNDEATAVSRIGESYDWTTVRNSHWAWQPIRRPPLPTVDKADWPQRPWDHFVLAQLESNGLAVAQPADKRTLLRRVYFDLIGLPPPPDAVEEFVHDSEPAALARVIDRLLGSVQYGERWGRFWLDVARYSDGLGGFLDNAHLPHAFQFRDWVIRSFNRDLPYDTFVRHQIAGDLLGEDESFFGSGFFAIGPTYHSDGGDPDSVAQAKSETLDDRVDTLSRAFLGLTVACARCHDHKFDPIPTRDYYSLAGVFNNTRNAERPLVAEAVVAEYNQAHAQIKELDAQITARDKEVKQDGRQPTAEEAAELEALRAKLTGLKQNAPDKYPVAHTLVDAGSSDMPVALRGNLRKPGEIAPRRFLQILSSAERAVFDQGSGRLQLAAAVVAPDNPLTARVMVNRVWLRHFGRGLVRSPSNFGTLGETPTHPGLLDWLAAEFIQSKWSLKQLHRTIMLSSTYQMSSQFHASNFERDGDNRLLWRMNPRRIDVEAWRDAMLDVTGDLDRTLGGSPTEHLHASRRRTLYSVVSRNGDRFESDAFLRLFDFPSPRATSAKRNTSTVPQQFLFMLNSPFMIERAIALSRRLAGEAEHDAARIDRAYQLLFARPPTPYEQAIGLRFVTAAQPADQFAGKPERALSAWEQYAQILLSANEFMHVR